MQLYRVPAFLLMIISFVEIYIIYADWYAFRKKWRESENLSLKDYTKNKFTLFWKSIIPVFCAIFGTMIAFFK